MQRDKAVLEHEEEAKVDALRAIKDGAYTTAAGQAGTTFAEAMLEKAQARARASRGAQNNGGDRVVVGPSAPVRDESASHQTRPSEDVTAQARDQSGSESSDDDDDDEAVPGRKVCIDVCVGRRRGTFRVQ